MIEKPTYEELEQRIKALEANTSRSKSTKETLLTSDGRFRSLVETTSDFIWEVDQNSIYTYVSPQVKDLLGYEPEELIGKSVFDFMLPDEAEKIRKLNKNAVESREAITMLETATVHKDGHLVALESNGVPIFGKDGEYLGYRGIDRDITARKRAEEALRESEERFRSLVELTSDLIWEINQNGIYTYVDPKVKDYLGYEPEEVIGKHYRDFMAEDSKKRLATTFKDQIENPRPFSRRNNIQLHKDGRQIMIETSGLPIFNIDGKLVGLRGIDTDITERKRAEEALRESEEKYRTLLNLIPDPIVVIQDGLHKLVNQAFTQVFGYTQQDVDKGLRMSELVQKQDQETVRQRYEDILGGKERLRNWIDLLAKNGSTIPCETFGVLIQYEGRPADLAVVRDISDRKQAEDELMRHRNHLEKLVKERTTELAHAKKAAEEARQSAEGANRAKSEFLANMSHELRTPLNSILGFSQIMGRDPELTPGQMESLSTIARSGEHLQELINDVLEISKIEAGHVMLHETEFDLHQMFDTLASMFRLRASDKGLSLQFEIAPKVPQYLLADDRRLRQVMINLLSNAIKFTAKGDILVRIDYCDGEAEEARLDIAVEDSGPGIAPEEIEALFEPFSQTRSGRSAQEGTGLGLPISQKFVQLMGGKINVSSNENQGSVFSFNIPVTEAKATDIQQSRPERRVMGLVPGQDAFRIMVVDDVKDNRDLMVKLLESVGFETREAKNGQSAIQIWEAWEPHLIWMDMAMPVMDGYEATKRIRNLESGLRNEAVTTRNLQPATRVPIIALTAVVFTEEKEKMLASGCDDIVRKPLREEEIFEAMYKHLGVRYIYEDDQVGGEIPEEKMVAGMLTPDKLGDLPKDILAELEQAIIDLDADLIQSVIERLCKYNIPAANGLRSLANNFQFDQILTLIQQTAKESRNE